MPGDRRAGAAEHAAHVNEAVGLLEAGAPAAEAARVLAGRLGCSERQARRYVSQAAASGRVPVPDEAGGVHRPASRSGWPPRSGSTPGRPAAGLLGRRAGPGGVPRPHSRERSAQVRELAVETEHVFSRHAAAEMSVAYGILVPQRRARTAAAAPEGGDGDGGGDLRPGSSARQAKDETIGSQLAALREHAAQSRLEVPEERVFADEGTPARRWAARPWRRCATWLPRAAWTSCWSTRQTGWPASSPTRPC